MTLDVGLSIGLYPSRRYIRVLHDTLGTSQTGRVHCQLQVKYNTGGSPIILT